MAGKGKAKGRGAGGGTASDGPFEAREKALEALALGDRPAARRLLEGAVRAFEGQGDDREALETGLAVGLSRLRDPDDGERARAFGDLAKVARGASDLRDEPLFLKALGYLAETVGDAKGAKALEAVARDGDAFLSPAGQAAAAAAVQAARATIPGTAGALPDAAALARLAEAGGPASRGYARLAEAEQARARGDAALSERLVVEAKEAALEAVDPFLYVLASAALAQAREAAGDRVGALTALFTCKASLEDLLGPEAGAQVVALIDALEARWGAGVFQEALAAYRAQFA